MTYEPNELMQAITSLSLNLGAFKANVIDVKDVVFDRVFRDICASNACGQYGKCWTCPPDAGDIDKLIAEAQMRADGIIRAAETEAELERKKAADGIKREIVEVSGALTEKLLEREINTDDHRVLIDSFIEEIGDGNE